MKKLIFGILSIVLSLGASAQEQITNLPTLYITTEGGAPILSKEEYTPGAMTVVTEVEDDAIQDKELGIRGRGNSTWNMAKKPYRVKFNKKINLFNRPAKAKSWTLLANYADKSMMRNAVAFELSRFMEFEFSPTAIFVDVVINGEQKGTYMVSDQMEVNGGRVDIDEMDETCVSGDELTGGYFLEIDGFGDSEPVHFYTNRWLCITVKSPDDDVIQTAQLNYIKNFVNNFESRLFSSNYRDPNNGYRARVDEKSLVDWYIASELTGNSDCFWSTYIYKKRGEDKLYFGPLWDFDIAFNNDNRLGNATRKLMRENAHNPRTWIDRLWKDQWFRDAVFIRYKELVDNGLEEYLTTFIDETAEMLEASQQLNYQIWPTLGHKVYLEQYVFSTYKQEVDYLKSYVHDRIEFLYNSFSSTSSISGISADASKLGYDAKYRVLSGKDIEVYSVDGRLVARGQGELSVESLPAGVYVAKSGAETVKFVR